MTEIQGGLADLLTRLKRDGVEAGEAERDRIVHDANERAERIEREAREKAARLLAEAEAERARLRQQLDAELRLAARDFVASFVQRVRREVTQPVVSEAVRGTASKPSFLEDTLRELVVERVKAQGTGATVEVGAERHDALVAFFARALDEKAAAGKVKVSGAPGLDGFKLQREGEGFVWDFSEAAVTAELARLVDPGLKRFFSLPGTEG